MYVDGRVGRRIGTVDHLGQGLVLIFLCILVSIWEMEDWYGHIIPSDGQVEASSVLSSSVVSTDIALNSLFLTLY